MVQATSLLSWRQALAVLLLASLVSPGLFLALDDGGGPPQGTGALPEGADGGAGDDGGAPDGGLGKTRALGDLAVVSWNYPTGSETEGIGNRPLVLNVTFENQEADLTLTATVDCDIVNSTSGAPETVTGANTFDMDPGEVRDHEFQWTPSGIGTYDLTATIDNPDADPDMSDNTLQIQVVIKNYTDIGVELVSPPEGAWMPMQSTQLTARVTNLGSYPLDEDLVIHVEAVNASFSGPPDIIDENKDVLMSQLPSPNDFVDVTFDSLFMPPYEGHFQFNVSFTYGKDRVAGNNLHESVVFFTTAVAPGVFVDAPPEKYAEPGGVAVNHKFKIYNTGSSPETFDWAAESGHDWIVSPIPPEGTTPEIQPSEYYERIIRIAVPAGTPAATNDRLTLRAVSTSDPAINHTGVTFTNTEVKRKVNVTAASDRYAFPGENFNMTFWVRNTGNIVETFSLETVLGDPDSGWKVSLKDPVHGWTKALDPNESQLVLVQVRVPEFDWENREDQRTCVDSAPMDITLRATAVNGPSSSDSANVYMKLILTASLTPRPGQIVIPRIDSAVPYDFNVTVKNTGNYIDMPEQEGWENFTLWVGNETVFETPWGDTGDSVRWDANVSDESINLSYGESEVVRLRVLAPAYPFNGTASVTMKARGEGLGLIPGTIKTSKVKVYLHVLQAAGVELVSNATDGSHPGDEDGDGLPDWRQATPGKPKHMVFNISNAGNGIDWYNVTVELSNPKWNYTLNLDENSTGKLVPRELNHSDPAHFQLFNVTLRIPRGTQVGTTCDVFVRAESGFNSSVNDTAMVTVTVGRGYGVDLEPEENNTIIDPGNSTVFEVSVTNTGNVRDTIILDWELKKTLAGWTVGVDRTQITLDPFNTTTINLTATAAPDAVADQVLRINLTGTSLADPEEFDLVNITVAAGEVINISFTPLYTGQVGGRPGDRVDFDILARNEGNIRTNVTFHVSQLYSGWTAVKNVTRIGSMMPGASQVINVNVTVDSLDDDPTMDELYEDGIYAGAINNVTLNATVTNTEREVGNISVRFTVLPLRRSTAYFPVVDDYQTTIPCVTGGTLVRPDSPLVATRDDDGFDGDLYEEMDGRTIPGRSEKYPVVVINTGNGIDSVELGINSSARHRPWARLSDTAFTLEVGEGASSTLTVTPEIYTRPYWNEMAPIMVEPRSTHGEVGVSAASYTTVGFLWVDKESVQVLLGDVVTFNITLMNVPLRGENLTAGFPLADDYNILTTINRGMGGSEGWMMLTPMNYTEEFTEAYEVRDVSLRMKGPLATTSSALKAQLEVRATSSVPTKTDMVEMEALAYYTDFWVDPGWVEHFGHPEGETAGIRFPIQAESNVIDLSMWARVYIGDEQVTQKLLVLNDTSADYEVYFNYTTPKLHWAQKQADVELRIVLDAEDQVKEAAPGEGVQAGEDNNRVTVDIQVRDAGIRGEVGFFFIFIALVGILVVFWYINQRYELYILMNVCLAVVGGFLFSLPWHALVSSTAGVNILGWSIIGVTFVLMGFVTICAAKDCARAYVVYRLGEKTKTFLDEEGSEAGEEREGGREAAPGPRPRRGSFWKGTDEREDEEDGPAAPDRKEEGGDLAEVEYKSLLLPTVISLLTAGLGMPLLILCVSASTYAATGDGGVFGAYQASYFGPGVPNVVYTIVLIFIALLIMFLILWIQISVWGKLKAAEDTLKAIKKDMEFHLSGAGSEGPGGGRGRSRGYDDEGGRTRVRPRNRDRRGGRDDRDRRPRDRDRGYQRDRGRDRYVDRGRPERRWSAGEEPRGRGRDRGRGRRDPGRYDDGYYEDHDDGYDDEDDGYDDDDHDDDRYDDDGSDDRYDDDYDDDDDDDDDYDDDDDDYDDDDDDYDDDDDDDDDYDDDDDDRDRRRGGGGRRGGRR